MIRACCRSSRRRPKGFFSWTCCKTGQSIAATYSPAPPSASLAVCLFPDGKILEGEYDGYGNLGGEDVFEVLGGGDREAGIDMDLENPTRTVLKWVLKVYYEGEAYEQLPTSQTCEYQGFFYGEGSWLEDQR